MPHQSTRSLGIKRLLMFSPVIVIGMAVLFAVDRHEFIFNESAATPEAPGPEDPRWTNSGGTSHAVAQKQANAWGLYDMLGNVYEWCEDWKGAYPGENVTDPQGPSTGPGRVVRGGSWYVHANRTRSFFRDFFTPDYRHGDVGFRVVAMTTE